MECCGNGGWNEGNVGNGNGNTGNHGGSEGNVGNQGGNRGGKVGNANGNAFRVRMCRMQKSRWGCGKWSGDAANQVELHGRLCKNKGKGEELRHTKSGEG